MLFGLVYFIAIERVRQKWYQHCRRFTIALLGVVWGSSLPHTSSLWLPCISAVCCK